MHSDSKPYFRERADRERGAEIILAFDRPQLLALSAFILHA
jgi:hypothetical protein